MRKSIPKLIRWGLLVMAILFIMLCRQCPSFYRRLPDNMGLLPYVIANASHLLDKEQFQTWIKRINPPIIEAYKNNRLYWQEKYSPLIGEVQEVAYNLFLKGNKIPSGQKNYAEVIGILLSMQKN